MKLAVLLVSFAFAFALRSGAAGADDVAALIKKGDVLDKELKISESLAVLLDAEKLAPNDPEVLHRIAREYGLSMDDVSDDAAKRDRGLKALEYAKRAVAADSNNALAQLALAVSYGRVAPFLDNKTKIAYSKLVKQHVDLALKLDASNDLAYYVLGAWHFELANLNPILRVIASAIYGTLPSATNEEAVENFKKALVLNPARLATYVELGRTYAAMKETNLATANLKKALSLPSREKDDEVAKQRARLALQKL